MWGGKNFDGTFFKINCFLGKECYNKNIMGKKEDFNQAKNKKGGLKSKSQKIKAKILKTYYGNPTLLYSFNSSIVIGTSQYPVSVSYVSASTPLI